MRQLHDQSTCTNWTSSESRFERSRITPFIRAAEFLTRLGSSQAIETDWFIWSVGPRPRHKVDHQHAVVFQSQEGIIVAWRERGTGIVMFPGFRWPKLITSKTSTSESWREAPGGLTRLGQGQGFFSTSLHRLHRLRFIFCLLLHVSASSLQQTSSGHIEGHIESRQQYKG